MTGDPTRRLARDIRAARAWSNRSRLEIGRHVGLSDEQIGRYERGEWIDPPKLAVVRAIAEFTQIPQAWRDAGFLAYEEEDATKRFADKARREAERRNGHHDPESEAPHDEDEADEAP